MIVFQYSLILCCTIFHVYMQRGLNNQYFDALNLGKDPQKVCQRLGKRLSDLKNYQFPTFDAKYHLGSAFGICNLEDSRVMHSPSFEGFISLLRVYVSKFTMVFYVNLLWDCKLYRKLNIKSRVKLLIKEHILIIQHFPMFSLLCNQIEQFLCHQTHKLKDHKFFFNVKVKEQHRKHKKRMSDGLLLKNLKK